MRIHTHTLSPHSASLCLLVILLFFPDHCSRVSSETIRPYPLRLRKATDAAIGESRPAAYARPLVCSLRQRPANANISLVRKGNHNRYAVVPERSRSRTFEQQNRRKRLLPLSGVGNTQPKGKHSVARRQTRPCSSYPIPPQIPPLLPCSSSPVVFRALSRCVWARNQRFDPLFHVDKVSVGKHC